MPSSPSRFTSTTMSSTIFATGSNGHRCPPSSAAPPGGTGWDPARIARGFAELMTRLGYARYGAQGGDWGAQVVTRLGALDPEHCVAIHLNMPIAERPADDVTLDDADRADLAALAA